MDYEATHFPIAPPAPVARRVGGLKGQVTITADFDAPLDLVDANPPAAPANASATPHLVLYLDFDGVLHHDDVWLDWRNRPYLRGPGTLFEYAERLVHILAPYPQVDIVLSTSWVRVKRFGYACKRLPPALRRRVIGATWHSRFALDDELVDWWMDRSTRYEQIARDARRRQPAQWLALDDDANGWPDAALAHLVRCDPQLGLSEPRVCLQLEERLAHLHSKADRIGAPT
nr:HAD domain-containing protein [Dyella humicola]